jgi:2-polyprenyl-6-methoxyphenol hydroxylase-like FAD-dependent oxidoreductase
LPAGGGGADRARRRACDGDPRPPRAFFLQPNGLAALERLGALPQVLERGARQERVTYYSAGGRRLFAYEFGELRHPHAYLVTIRVDLLQETLAERLAELGGEPPVTGADFAGVVRTNGAVTGDATATPGASAICPHAAP